MGGDHRRRCLNTSLPVSPQRKKGRCSARGGGLSGKYRMDTDNLCACGCGDPAPPGARFIKQHQLRKANLDRALKAAALKAAPDAPAAPALDDATAQHWEATRRH